MVIPKRKRVLPTLLATALLLGLLGASDAVSYSDIPLEHWSVSEVEKASEYGLMQGCGEGIFGLGENLTRASFVTMLGRMLDWEMVTPEIPSFTDCPAGKWYYSEVETARSQGVVDAEERFYPDAPITRSEMAVMLVKALGYDTLAETAAGFDSPFADVSEYVGYINLAYDIGMTNGVAISDGTRAFLPNATAKREEAAAMLVRVYERYTAGLNWVHGFYAFSSYDQIDLTAQMDAVSVGWARISIDPITGRPWLNSTSADGNEWVKPAQSALATDFFRGNGTSCNLNVYASVWDSVTLSDGTTTNAAAAILSTAEARTQTVGTLVAAAGDYAGITIDFEGMKKDLKAQFTDFMTELRKALPAHKTLYVCVMPDNWFDGFDFRALGELCDKVIMMAHDYQWASIPDYYVGTTKTDCPVTPFPQIYRALRAVTDNETGVQERSKVALAISIASTGFEVDGEGKLLSQTFYNPIPATIIARLRQADTECYYSEVYRNPYICYTAENGIRYRLWYEDARSVQDKLELAKMFGVTGVSLWRIGNIPNYDDSGLFYNIWDSILALK